MQRDEETKDETVGLADLARLLQRIEARLGEQSAVALGREAAASYKVQPSAVVDWLADQRATDQLSITTSNY